MSNFIKDIATVEGISAVPTILNVICQTTGMGFAAVARVTDQRWIACSVLDRIGFGLKPGGELKVDTTICHEIRQSGRAVVIDHVAEDAAYCEHHTPRQYGFQSYVSMPIILPGGEFFGTLCAIDPRPARVNTPEIIGMFKLFAELIAFHLDASRKLAHSESRLHAQLEVAELREQFIGVLGHDLRSPLEAVSMGMTLLSETELNEEQTATVGMMKRSVSRMSDLISDTLDFTRGRLGGGIALESRSVLPVREPLEHVLDEVRVRWPGRALDVHFDLTEPVQHDRKRLAQLFTNLLSNAMMHGKRDQPVIVRASSGGGTFELSVANAADPIPPAVLDRLFEPFSRGSAGDHQQGLGLGLYIASEIARSHGGTLDVTSSGGEVRFTFRMPSVTTPASEAADVPVEPSPGTPLKAVPSVDMETPTKPSSVRVLVIEDHPETLNTLTRLLTRRGHVVTPASSGAHAREEFARGTFDLIVSDLGLEDCSGIDLIAELRARQSVPVPAIALSGYGMESDIERSRAAGFVEHLTKPVDFERLIQMVGQLVAKPA